MTGDPIKLNNFKFICKGRSIEFCWEIWVCSKRINGSRLHVKVSLNSKCHCILSGKYVFDTARYWWRGFIATWIEVYEAVPKMSGGTGIYKPMKVTPCMQDNLTPINQWLKVRWN